MLKSGVISIDNHMRPNQIKSKLLKTKDHSQKLFLSNSIVQLGIIQNVTNIIDDMGLLINTLS